VPADEIHTHTLSQRSCLTEVWIAPFYKQWSDRSFLSISFSTPLIPTCFMPDSFRDFILVEGPVPAPVRISLHIPSSRKLPDEHPYFRKGIEWIFIPAIALSETAQAEFYESEIPPAQEIHISFLTDIAGIPVSEIALGLDQGDRFATALFPASGDMMIMSEYFVHEHIRTAPKRDGEFSRGVCLAALRFAAGQWHPLTELWQQPDLGKYACLFLGAAPPEGIPFRSGIFQWQ
jgi:hypothetical protein